VNTSQVRTLCEEKSEVTERMIRRAPLERPDILKISANLNAYSLRSTQFLNLNLWETAGR
jgi:hypothetical protein